MPGKTNAKRLVSVLPTLAVVEPVKDREHVAVRRPKKKALNDPIDRPMVDEQSTASIQLMKMSDGRCAMNGGDERLTETGLVGDTMFYYFISIDIVGD